MLSNIRGQAPVGLMSVLPVFSLTGCDMFTPSNEAIRSLVPQSWLKTSRILGCLGRTLTPNPARKWNDQENSRPDLPDKGLVSY